MTDPHPDTPEGGGSLQLRQYIALRRKGVERADACAETGMSLTEAAMWDADEDRGELSWVGKPSLARARARASAPAPASEEATEKGSTMEDGTRMTMSVNGGPEFDVTDAINAVSEARQLVADGLPGNNGAEQLRQYIERVERVQEEIDGLNADKADIFAEAKAVGFDTKVMKTVIKRRKDGQTVTAEMDALVATYERALSPQFALGLDG